MMTISVADVLNNALAETGWEKFHPYVFRDGDFVLYVGKTDQNIIDRLDEHLGLTYREMSLVGRLVEENAPKSESWLIDLRTVDECETFVRYHFPASKGLDVEIAERSLILQFSPPLNIQSNPHPRALPRKYTQRKEALMRAAHRKVFGG